MKLFLLATFLWTTPVFAQPAALPVDPINQLPPATVVAVVDGESITVRDLDDYAKRHDGRQLFELNQQLYDLRKAILGQIVGERLLQAEAARTGKTVDELLESVIKIEAATEDEILEVFNSTQQTAIDYATARPLIVNFLDRKKRAQAREKYIQELMKNAKKNAKPLAIYLQPPRFQIAVSAADPVRGSGPVDLIEFADFECPYCRKAQPIIEQLLDKYDSKVRHVWKDFPLGIHKNAMAAAVAARCAREQGKFWEYHDTLFANQQNLASPDLKEYAGHVGLNLQEFERCQRTHQRSQIVATADNLPVRSTPTVFINGRMIVGLAPLEDYERIIEEELLN